MNQVYKTLPDDRPITSLHVVEDVERCPKGYVPVSKTHDQDSDADLWKESGFFGKKCTRYLCISKTEGVQDFVVQSLCVIGDKEAPPQGFKSIPKTHDSEQKGWRKKQLCYKIGHVSTSDSAVTDIIILSRMKKAPEEFTFLGEINGLTLCFKIGKATAANSNSFYPKVPYPILPFQRGTSNPTSPENTSQNVLSRSSGSGPENGVHGADVLRPFRPAPKPPASIYATMSGYNESSPVGQQQYLVLETIVEETSDDLCSESDKSGPTGWNSDSDTDSVIHMPKTSGGCKWREEDFSEEVPKKKRCRRMEKVSFSDDEEPVENVESTSLSSRSSSLLAFESLEKHCEDVFVTTASSDPFGSSVTIEPTRWTYRRSSESFRELKDELESSDEEFAFNSSVDTLHRSGSFRSSLPSDVRLRSYRSFDSLNLFEDTSPLTYTIPELSQSQSALDYEKAKEQEQEFVIRDKKLTATTADLSAMADSYDTGFYSPKHTFRRKSDTASFHFKEPHIRDRLEVPGRKSYSAEGLKPRMQAREKTDESARGDRGKSEPCLSLPAKSSTENLSEDSGFDDQISSKGKLGFVNFRNSISSILADEYSSPSESSSSHYSDCIGSEEGSTVSTEGREHSRFVYRNIASLKINEEQEQEQEPETEVRGSSSEKDDVEVNFNPGQSQTHMFSCAREEEPFKQGEIEKLIATPVTFASFDCMDLNEAYLNADVRPRPEFITFCKGGQSSSHARSDYDLKRESNEFFCGTMNNRLEKSCGKRLPVFSTPNLLAGDDDFIRNVPSAASSLTHVPLKCFDGDETDRGERHQLVGFRKNQLSSGVGSQSSSGIKGVHFCPVVSEVSWQDSYSEDDSSSSSSSSSSPSSSSGSSDPSTDEMSNRSLEELCKMENDDEEFHEVEEKSIPRYNNSGFISAGPERNFVNKDEAEDRRDENLTQSYGEDRKPSNVNISSNENKPHVEKKPVTPPIHVTPTSSGHVFVGDPAQANAERRTRLSVSESNLPTEYHASDNERDRCSPPSLSVAAPETGVAMKKSKSRFGGFFERFSFRRRKASGGNSKKPNGRKENENKDKDVAAVRHGNSHEDVTIIPLHGPENDADIKEIVRSVVTPHVVSAKPPLPPSLQRMSGSSRKRSPPSGTVSVGLQDDDAHGKGKMPAVRGGVSAGHDFTDNSLSDAENPVGLLETDLDTHITIESGGRKPLTQCNVASSKKARSLMDLGLGDMSVHRDQEQNLPSGYLEPSHRSHGSVAVDDRAKSMEFLLDKENQAAILKKIPKCRLTEAEAKACKRYLSRPPENELQKGGTAERVMSEHQLRVQRSLQKLNIPDWYKSSAVAQTPQGFLLKRDSRREHQGWPGLGSKTTSLSSLGSSQSAAARSPTSHILSPSPTPHLFTRWSTSRLNSGMNSSSTSPSGSARSSFNYRQPYLGWRSQEKLTRPRTPAERLAAGLLPLQKQQNSVQYNSQSSVNPNLSDVRTSIKEVTSAIVHYVSGVRENGSKETLRSHNAGASPSPSPKWQSSPRGSSGRLCWLESSFVGSKPLDQPETPLALTEPSSIKPESRNAELHLDLKPHPEVNHVAPHRLNENTSAKSEEEGFEKAFEVRARPSPASTTLDDILESLLGLPPTSRSPSPGPPSGAAFSPSRGRPILPLPDRQLQRHSCGDIRADVSGSASDPGKSSFAKEVTTQRRKSECGGEIVLKRQGSLEHKLKRSSENRDGNKNLKQTNANLTDALVKCRYSKCGKTATVLDAKKTFKTCHNCSHVYCSRECRRAHWERHRRTCLHSRVGALCRQVLATVKNDSKALHHLSLLARRGYLTHGRGAVKIFFSSPELAEKFVIRGFDELSEPAFVKWSDLLPAEMGADLFAELMKICKSYNPETRLVLYVAICVVSEVPTTGAVKWERQLVSRCCKLQLDKSLTPPKVDKNVPPPLPPRRSSSECTNITREMENPETLILTSLPGISGKISERKIREISFTNIQRELKQRGVSLKRQFPEVYKKLCSYVEGTSEHFTPATIYPRDAVSGKTFMCIIMPDSEPEKLELVPKDSTRVQTIDVSVERKSASPHHN